jgi:hypothetical protein
VTPPRAPTDGRPATRHVPPRARAVVGEQVRAVGLALRAPALAAAALLAVATAIAAADLRRGGGDGGFHPELSTLPSAAGLLLPAFVWRGEPRFGPSFFWTLPVDRRRHALAKVLAGWAWLMAAVALFSLWLLAFALASGGGVLADEAVRLLPGAPPAGLPIPQPVDAAALQTARWSREPLLWLVPFTSATAAYAIASAAALGLRHPLRWLAGAALALLLSLAVIRAADARRAGELLQGAVRTVCVGRYGLDALLTARAETLSTDVTLTTGEVLRVWRGRPEVGTWLAATLLWTGGGLGALWVAASRHRERRKT